MSRIPASGCLFSPSCAIDTSQASWGGVGTKQAELDETELDEADLSRWGGGKQGEWGGVFKTRLWRFLPMNFDAEPGGLDIPALLH